jgi:hypothetical protein
VPRQHQYPPLQMRTFIPAALLVVGATLLALETTSAAAGIPPASAGAAMGTAAENSSNIQKWLTDSDAQWAATLSQEALAPTEAELDKLFQRYAVSVDARLAEARAAGNLEVVLIWQKEKDVIAPWKQLPAEDDPKDPPALKQLRAAARAEMMKLAKTRADKTKAILARYDAALNQAQFALTQQARFDEALLLKTRRDDLAANGLPGSKEALAAAPRPFPPPPFTAPPVSAARAPAPGTPAPSTPAPVVAAAPSVRFAEVEAERAIIRPLMSREHAWSNRDYGIGRVPVRFKGYQFTQFPVHAKSLKFKVKTNGLVNLCVPSKWWNPRSDEAPGPDHRSEAQLMSEGWKREPGDELFIDNKRWWVFSRQCKAGEQFSISTEKDGSPILIYR